MSLFLFFWHEVFLLGCEWGGGKVIFFLQEKCKHKQWNFFPQNWKAKKNYAGSMFLFELRKTLGFGLTLKVFYTLNWRNLKVSWVCYDLIIMKYFGCFKINVLGDWFGCSLHLYRPRQTRRTLPNAFLAQNAWTGLYLCVDLMISSRLNKILFWQKEIGGPFNLGLRN